MGLDIGPKTLDRYRQLLEVKAVSQQDFDDASSALRQAEVGIAVSSAVDVAKGAASVVLTTEGLASILELAKVGRMTLPSAIVGGQNLAKETVSEESSLGCRQSSVNVLASKATNVPCTF